MPSYFSDNDDLQFYFDRGDEARHPGSAAAAAATARSTSAGEASATRADTLPVAGLNTSPVRSGGFSYALPPIQ